MIFSSNAVPFEDAEYISSFVVVHPWPALWAHSYSLDCLLRFFPSRRDSGRMTLYQAGSVELREYILILEMFLTFLRFQY